MNRRTDRPAVLRDSWRPDEIHQPLVRRAKKVCSLLVITAFLLFAIFAFFFLLAEPILHPNTFTLLATGDSSEAKSIPPVHFANSDLEKFEALTPFLARDALDWLDQPIHLVPNQELNQLQEKIQDLESGSRDVLILYVSAHGLVIDGNACLIVDGFERSSPGVGSFSIRSLIQLVSESSFRTRLLIIDSGQLPLDAWLGNIANQFQHRLRESIGDFEQSNIWILNSNDLGQHSVITESAKSSVFAHFVRQGLSPHGDLNGDGILRLQEFTEYVSQMVDAYSRQQSDAPVQRPILLASPGSQADPVLMSVETTPELSLSPDNKSPQSPESKAESKQVSLTNQSVSKPEPETVTERDSSGNQAKTDIDNSSGAEVPETKSEVSPAGADKLQSGENASPAEVALAPNLSDTNPFLFRELAKPELGLNIETSSQDLQELESTWQKIYGTHSDLIKTVWKIYFSLENSAVYPRRPLDYAAVEWRRLGEMIAHHDFRIRRQLTPDRSADRLREILAALTAIQLENPLPASGKLEPAIKITERRTRPEIGLNSAMSIAHLRALGQQGYCRLPTATVQLLTRFESALVQPNSTQLKQLLAATPLLQQWREPQLAQRILQRDNLSWDEQRHAILLDLMGGHSTNPLSIAYDGIAQKFKRARDQRTLGIQILLEQTVPNWRDIGSSLLADARRSFHAANHDFQVIQNAHALRNEILFRLPYYLKMPFADSQSYTSEIYHRLDQLLEATDELVLRLKQRDKKEIASSVLEALNSVLNKNHAFNELLISAGKAGPRSGTQKSLFNRQAALLTPGIDQMMRSKILLSLQLESPPDEIFDVPNPSEARTIEGETAIPNELMIYQRQLSLFMKFARLGEWANSAVFQELQTGMEQCFAGDLRSPPSREHREKIDKVSRLISTFLRSVPGQINQRLMKLQDLSNTELRIQHLNRFEDLMTLRLLIDSRDSQLADSVADYSKILHPARCFSMLLQQRLEIQDALERETQNQIANFQKPLEFQRMAANELPGQPKLERSQSVPLEIRGVDQLSLATQKAKWVDFELNYRGNEAEPVWIIAEFDPNKIDVNPEIRERLIKRHRLLVDSPELLDPIRYLPTLRELQKSNEKLLPPNMILRPGETRKIRLEIANPSDSARTHLYLTMVSSHGIARHRTTILMPAQSDWELTLDSPFSETVHSGSEMIVSPLPNHTVDYDLALRNLSGRPRKISLELLAARGEVTTLPPSGELSVKQRIDYFESVGNPSSIYGIGEMMIAASPEFQSVPLQSKPSKSEKETEPEKPGQAESMVQIRHGLFMVLTDQVSLKSRIWLVRFRPQMPRHYLSATARYNPLQERVIIELSRPADAVIPKGGHMVKCEFENPLAIGAESYLEAQIMPGKRTIQLFAHVPKSNNRIEKVHIHVDDYPRSFIFNIPCGNRSENVTESRNEMRIRINSPTVGLGFPAPVRSIPVKFEVDAPVGAFSDSRDLVNLGLDADRDRELSEETSMHWKTDRQATVWVSEIGNSRSLRLVNRVEDFSVNLPGANYRNLKVNLLARLQIGNKIIWSNPREIVLDAAPPKIIDIKTIPAGIVSQDGNLSVRIIADDGQMSGVKAIQVGFLDAVTENIDEKKPLAEAKIQPDNSWVAELPLADIPVGNQKAVVVATDQVGNESPPEVFSFRVITKADKEKMAATLVVKGSVRYYKSPQGNVPIQIRSAEGKTFAATTASDGTFQISGILPGKYFLKAKSVIRNKPRIAELKLDLQAGQPPKKLDIELK